MSRTLVQQASVRTNTVPGSTCTINVPAVTFADLWGNYVTGKPYDDPNGQYQNQCAIRMSATLHRVGVEMKSFSQTVVKPSPGKATLGRILLDGKPAATRADEMAAWLQLQPFCGLARKPEGVTGKDWESKVKGRTGIIFFGGYWTREGESAATASGGHIDLWNKDTMTPSFHTFLRFRLGIHRPWFGAYSDLRMAKVILFFEVK